MNCHAVACGKPSGKNKLCKKHSKGVTKTQLKKMNTDLDLLREHCVELAIQEGYLTSDLSHKKAAITERSDDEDGAEDVVRPRRVMR